MMEKLQYITQNHPDKSHALLCREACEAGVSWIQLRLKDVTYDLFLAEALECRKITREYGAKLIINDNLSIALACEADGIHLGQDDLNTKEARKLVPENFIIGGTANTLYEIIKHAKNGVDYVGLGPFRFTPTKSTLSPVLGVEGYADRLNELENQGMEIPVIAIGGIRTEDLADLMKTGIHGVAVSGLITEEEEKKNLVQEIKKHLNYARI